MHHESVLPLHSPRVSEVKHIILFLEISIKIKTLFKAFPTSSPLQMRDRKAHRHFCLFCRSLLSTDFPFTSHNHCSIYNVCDIHKNKVKLPAVAYTLSRILNYLSIVYGLKFFLHFLTFCQVNFKTHHSSFCWTKCISLRYSSKLWYWLCSICFTSNCGSHWCWSNTEFFLFVIFVLSLLWHWDSLHKLNIIIF